MNRQTKKATKIESKTRRKKTATRTTEKLTLYDRLSQLTYRQACGILGGEGALLLRRAWTFEELDVENDVYLGEDLFRLSIHEPGLKPATVTIMAAPSAKFKLAVCCSHCNPQKQPNRFCEHVAATLSFVLEEKSLIGLADAPDLETPAELLSEKKLRQRALHERLERSRTEKYDIKPVDKEIARQSPWTDYLLTSETSGKTYRIALRGKEPGDSYCSCPDFRTNRLGTCKHIMNVLRRVEKKFGKAALEKPYENHESFVYLRYAEEQTLHLALPERTDECDCEDCKAVMKIAKPFLNRPIENVHALIKALSKLEALDEHVTIYPDAEQWINDRIFRDRVTELVTDIRKAPEKHPLRKTLLNAELLPYQLDGIAFAVGAGRAILADDMGLGKTVQGIGVAELLAQVADIRKVLIVCPASVKSQWRSEILRFAPQRSVQLVLGTAEERYEQYDNETFFTICNYEQVMRDRMPIERTRWDLIILDEGQRIKNWGAKTTQAVKTLRSPYALVLSGTPMENRLDELYSVVQFVDDRRLLPAYRFFHRHRIVEDSGRVAGYKNLEEVREQLKPILLRRTKESVMLQLPERSTEIVRVTPTREQMEIHAAQMMTVMSIVGKKHLTEMDLLRLQKALLLARMSADGTFLVNKTKPNFSSKLDRLSELLEELLAEPERKIVLFSEWTTMLDLIEPILKRNQVQSVRLDGKVPQKKRQMLVHQFRDDPDCRVFLTTNAGSVGLNLQSANTVVNVDLPWNPAILEQRIGRAHRMGQKRHVQVFLLVTEETIEEQMLATLSAKHDLALAALDIGSEVNEVMLKTGVEELKRRLEVLLGAKPAASQDVTKLEETVSEADEFVTKNTEKPHSREEAIVHSGAEMLGSFLNAAVGFLGTFAAPGTVDQASARATSLLGEDFVPKLQSVASKSVKLETDESGHTRISLTLPEKPILDDLFRAATDFFSQLGGTKEP